MTHVSWLHMTGRDDEQICPSHFRRAFQGCKNPLLPLIQQLLIVFSLNALEPISPGDVNTGSPAKLSLNPKTRISKRTHALMSRD